MLKKVLESFTEAQESVIHELNYALAELTAGRQEEAFNSIRNLRDELVTDVIISRGGLPEEKLDNLIHLKEYKKELNTSATNENV